MNKGVLGGLQVRDRLAKRGSRMRATRGGLWPIRSDRTRRTEHSLGAKFGRRRRRLDAPLAVLHGSVSQECAPARQIRRGAPARLRRLALGSRLGVDCRPGRARRSALRVARPPWTACRLAPRRTATWLATPIWVSSSTVSSEPLSSGEKFAGARTAACDGACARISMAATQAMSVRQQISPHRDIRRLAQKARIITTLNPTSKAGRGQSRRAERPSP